jgi:hypothetical protein
VRERRLAFDFISLNARALELIFAVREQSKEFIKRDVEERRFRTLKEQLSQAEAPVTPFALTSKIVRPFGLMILRFFQSSPSRKT